MIGTYFRLLVIFSHWITPLFHLVLKGVSLLCPAWYPLVLQLWCPSACWKEMISCKCLWILSVWFCLLQVGKSRLNLLQILRATKVRWKKYEVSGMFWGKAQELDAAAGRLLQWGSNLSLGSKSGNLIRKKKKIEKRSCGSLYWEMQRQMCRFWT